MTNDWIEHNGGPQPVADDVWVEAQWPFAGAHFSGEPDEVEQASELPWEGCKLHYRILNQHLIDAARLEGIRLGLEAAERKLHQLADAATRPSSLILLAGGDRIRDINPDTIAREAQYMRSGKEAKDD